MDEPNAHEGLANLHEAVAHGVGEYVRKHAHINGYERFWSGLKRTHKGVLQKLIPKALNRYVQEFAERHNRREMDTRDQMGLISKGLEGRRLVYSELIADNGLGFYAEAVKAFVISCRGRVWLNEPFGQEQVECRGD